MTSEINAAAGAPAAAGPGEAGASPATETNGTGSAREGAHHWWLERLTSLATLLLFVWFVVSMLRLPAHDHTTVTEWLSFPTAAVPMLLLVFATFWHIKMGMQVIVEDYVHEPAARLFSLALLNFAVVLAAAFAVFAILKIAIGGGAG